MLEFILEYWIQFLFGLIVSFLCFLYRKIIYHYRIVNYTKNGVKVLLKGEIIRRYQEYKKLDCISIFDREIINDLYQEYKNLGGNGMIQDMIENISDIPLETERGGD